MQGVSVAWHELSAKPCSVLAPPDSLGNSRGIEGSLRGGTIYEKFFQTKIAEKSILDEEKK